MEAIIESGREHGAFEASRNLLENLRYFRKALEERESEGLNALVEPDVLNRLLALEEDESFFPAGMPMDKAKALQWLDGLSLAIDALGKAPKQRMIRDSVENLNSLAQSLSNMEQSVAVLVERLKEQGLAADEAERADALVKVLERDIQSRTCFLAQKAKAISGYLGN